MLKTFLLRKLRSEGFFIRHVIQRESNRSFGVQMVDSSNKIITPIPYKIFAEWLDNSYIEVTSSRRVPGVPDLQYQYHSINSNYQFDLNMFNLSLDDLQVNWNGYFGGGRFHALVSEEEWNLVGDLLQRQPPLFTLDEILLLGKFLIPSFIHSSNYTYFENFTVGYGLDESVITALEGAIPALYAAYHDPAHYAISFDDFDVALRGFVKLAEVRRAIRVRR